jgi:transcriptional regulator with XRE-family HTH domain
MKTTEKRDRGSKESVRKALGMRIVEARERRGWSQAELARRLEVSRERLGAWERGRSAAGLEELELLSDVLKVPFEELARGRRVEEVIGIKELEVLAEQVVSMARLLKPWIRLVQATRDPAAAKRRS